MSEPDHTTSTPLESGIYAIRCLANGKVYVGSTGNFAKRKGVHWSLLKGEKHYSRHLQGAWRKYGEDSFAFEVVERVPPAQLVEREERHIALLDATNPDKGYNKSKFGNSCLGCKHSEEARARHSAAGRARVLTPACVERLRAMSAAANMLARSPESRAKQSASRRGKKASPEAVAKTAAALRGRPLPLETKLKMRIAAQTRPPMTDETRAKHSAALRGKKRSPEAIAKTSAANRGRKMSPDVLAAMTARNKARGIPPEQQARMKAAQQEHRRRRKQSGPPRRPAEVQGLLFDLD